MQKFLKTAIVASAILAFGSTVGAAATFNTNLRVGSTGADVSALQSWLISKGFDIPSISSSKAQPGYFGIQTKKAVIAYQASVGLPNTGFVGPLTRGILNGSSPVVSATPFVCPAWITCTPTPGATSPATVINTPQVNDRKDGSLTLSQSSYVSSSQTLKKGDMNKPILSTKAQATVGSVTISRFDVHFSSRPWLLFSSLTLTDSNGNVLGTKTLTGASDVTEITVNSDYLVRFDGVNTVVMPGADKTLVVNANVLAATDKIPTAGLTINVSIDTNATRTINGLGYTDSVGFAQTNTLTLSGTGSTADLYTNVSPTTPNTRTESISASNVTLNENLGSFDIKVQNQGANISSLTFYIKNNKGYTGSTLFQNVRLYNGSTQIGGANTFTTTGGVATATFTNLNIPLIQDAWKTLTLQADVLATSTSFSASSTLVSLSTVGTDNNYNTVTLTNSANRVSNDLVFVPNAGINISGISGTRGTPSISSNAIWTYGYNYLISFTVNNTGNNPIYISKTTNTAIATTTSFGPNASTTSTVTTTTPSGNNINGDTVNAYAINPNSSKTFIYNFAIDNTNGTNAPKKINITQINYGTSDTDASLNVNYNLDSAFVSAP